MYKIGELSKLCNMSVKTLRYYDSEGLLVPDRIDNFTGYRYYSASKLADCYRIIALKELGFSLDEIRRQLTLGDNKKIIGILNSKLDELNLLVENTQTRLRKIESIKNGLMEGESKIFNIIIRETDEIRVACVRKYYKSKSEALLKASEIAEKLPKSMVGKRRIVINYETEYKESDFDLAACAEITDILPEESCYDEKIIPFAGGDVASLCCKESELDDAYKAITEHLDRSNYKVCGAYYEIYHGDGTVELKVPVSGMSKAPLYVSVDANEPFADDPEVCGKWKVVDIVPMREQFIYGKPKCSCPTWLHELYFIDGGKGYWAVDGWTKGTMFTGGPKPDTQYANHYTIENIDGHKLLFLEMTDCGDSGIGFGVPEIWVYEKEDDRHYASKEEFRKCDKIDYPFVNDENVLGKWNVRDFVIRKEDFAPDKQNLKQEDLFALSVEFGENGVYVSTTQNGTNSIASVWTKGLVLNRREKTASAYEIKTIDGRDYLFEEWKCGDYSFGGGRVYFYVFTRE